MKPARLLLFGWGARDGILVFSVGGGSREHGISIAEYGLTLATPRMEARLVDDAAGYQDPGIRRGVQDLVRIDITRSRGLLRTARLSSL